MGVKSLVKSMTYKGYRATNSVKNSKKYGHMSNIWQTIASIESHKFLNGII